MLSQSPNSPDYCKEVKVIRGEWVKHEQGLNDTVVYHIHGGAYLVGSHKMDRYVSYFFSKYGNAKVFATSYRLAPQYQFPCAVIDVISGYLYLLKEFPQPNRIIISGESAGGGLVMALLQAIREMKLPKPAGAILMSPWVDMTLSCKSFMANGQTDYLPANNIERVTDLYAPLDRVKSPFVSPLFGNLEDLPPILIQTGSLERLFDEDVLLALKLSQQNPSTGIELEIYLDQIHVFHVFTKLEVSRIAFERAGDFIKRAVQGQVKDSKLAIIEPRGRIHPVIPLKSNL